MNDKVILNEVESSEKAEEVEQLLIYLGLKDELFAHFISRGLNSIEEFINMDHYGINRNILTESKKILILKNISLVLDKINCFRENKGSTEENDVPIEDFSVLEMIRKSYFEFEGTKLTKELLIKGFKLKKKPNICLPKHFQEQNISSESISASQLSSKKITSIDDIEGFKNLMYLYLNDNKLQIMENINFTNLVYLDLSNNFIRRIENIDKLINLQHLNLEKNCISIVENINYNNNLEYLNLSKQYLTRRQSLIILDNFTCLDNKITTILLEGNNINDVYPLKILQNLQKLSLNDNLICEFNMVVEILSEMNFLGNLTLAKNPFIESFKNYRDIIILQNKSLIEFDNKTVTDNEKKYIKSIFQLKYGKAKKEKLENYKPQNNKDFNIEINIDKIERLDDLKNDHKLYNLDNRIFKHNKILTHQNSKAKK